MPNAFLPVFLMVVCAIGLAVGLLLIARLFNPGRPSRVTRMPYESGMDPIHDTRRRFDVRFHLLAIAFLVFDVELLFLYPWAVAMSGEGRGERGERPVATSGSEFVANANVQPVSGHPITTSAFAETIRPHPLPLSQRERGVVFGQPLSGDGKHQPLSPLPSPLSPHTGINAAVAAGQVESRDLAFGGAMVFLLLLTLGYVYDWRKGVFRWR